MERRRPVGRPRRRWEDEVAEDARRMFGVGLAKDRDRWGDKLKEIKARSGL